MNSLYHILLAFITVVMVGLSDVQAQAQLRGRDDGGRPEEDNISGFRDDPNVIHFATGQFSEGSGDVEEAEENDNQSSSSPSRLSTLNVKPALTAEVYPNPASDFLQINLGVESDVQITMHNLVGKEVYHYTGTIKSLRISLDGFNPGVYFVSAYTDQERIVKKVRVTP